MLLALCLSLTVCLAQSQNGLTRCNPPPGQPNCNCKTSSGALINMTKIALDNGKPRFVSANLNDGSGYSYDYNPCYGYTIEGSKCLDGTAVCQEDPNSSNQYLIATIITEEMYSNADGEYELHYSGGEDTRSAVVHLHCDQAEQPRITAEGDKVTALSYVFHLYTKEVCFSGSGSVAGYIGLILILLCIFSLVGYFVAGILILKFHFHRSGTDIIPQKKFWFALPFLVKDGVLFTISPLVRLKFKDYQAIHGISKA